MTLYYAGRSGRESKQRTVANERAGVVSPKVAAVLLGGVRTSAPTEAIKFEISKKASRRIATKVELAAARRRTPPNGP
jgi:hypothetical protein